MKLKKIIEKLDGVVKVEGNISLEIKGLTCNSKEVKDSYLFIAVKGSAFNGVDFVDDSVSRGAHAVILEKKYSNGGFSFRKGPAYIYVEDARLAMQQAAEAFYGDVSNRFKLIGVTGTNGKTTTTYLIESILKNIGKNTGVVGTVNYRFGKRIIRSTNTTPGILDLYGLLHNMEEEDIRHCVMEVSSHSLEQGRLGLIKFDAAIFTNLSREHLDYHKDMEQYFASKMKLFKKIKKGGGAIINKDDPYGVRILDELEGEKDINIITYGIGSSADVHAEDIEATLEGLSFKVKARLKARENDVEAFIHSRLIGRYNVYNILAAIACGLSMDIDINDIKEAVAGLEVLPGRLESIDCGQDFMVFVDYAHTEQGLMDVLKALKDLEPKRLLVVFGCGGDRDKGKRPAMGRIATELANKVFIASDNPRSEEPMDIIKEIQNGIDKTKDNYIIEIDRFKAIEKALNEAKRGDVVVIAGKGHEAYQIHKDVTLPFDDRDVVRKILRKRCLCLQ